MTPDEAAGWAVVAMLLIAAGLLGILMSVAKLIHDAFEDPDD